MSHMYRKDDGWHDSDEGKPLANTIQVGDKVTILRYAGRNIDGTLDWKPATGRAVMRGPHGWVLNMGGRYGTPGIATDENTISVKRGKR